MISTLILFLLGLVLILTELFTPGLVVGTIGAVLVVYSIVRAFSEQGIAMGLALTATAVAAVPTILVYGFRRISLKRELSAAEGYRSGPEGLDALAGQEGLAVTALRPVGTAEIGGRRLSVVAETGVIDPDSRIVVVKVEGSRVFVRLA